VRVLVLVATCALLTVGSATAADFGANDDAGKWLPDAGASAWADHPGRPTPGRPFELVKMMRPRWSYQVSASYWRITGNWMR